MATSPSTFFPTTAPAYAPTTSSPPPPFGFEAPASGFSPAPPYGRYSFPSTTVFPPPPSGFGAPAPGFFSAPEYAPYTLPSATTYPHPFPSTFPSPIPTQIDPNQPPPAATLFHGNLYHSPFSPTPYHLPVQADPQTDAILPPPTSGQPWVASSPRRELEPMGFFLSEPPHTPAPTSTCLSPCLASLGVFGNTTASSAATPAPTTTPSAATLAPAKAAISKNMPRVLRDINRRLDVHEIQSRRSIASLQSELSKLVDMASSLNNSLEKALSMVSSSASSTTTDETPSVVPKAFGEMPAPNSRHDTHDIAPGYENNYYGYPNQIQSSCVKDGSTSLSEKYVDGVPQSYGFNNLVSQSLFLADGTECRNYALPENYPLEMAIPERVFTVYEDESDGCSNESVRVFTGTPEQLTYEEQHENLQAPKCFCQPIFSSKRPTVGIFSLINEQKLGNGLCGKSVKPQEVNNKQWNILMTEAGRKEWDPGTLKIKMDIPAVVKSSSSEGLPHAVIVSPNILLSMIVYATTSIPNIPVSLPLYMPWDPGTALPLLSSNTQLHGQAIQPARNATTVVGSSVARPSRCTCLPFCSQNICVYWASVNGMTPYFYWDPGVLVMHSEITHNSIRTTRDAEWSKFSSPTSCELPQSSGVKWSTFHVMSNSLNAIFSVRMMQNAIQCLRCWSAINTSYQSSLALSYFTNHMLLVLSASYEEVTEHCLADQEQQNYEQALTCFNKPHRVQFVHLTTEFSILISDACTQYDTSNGAKSVLHGTSLVLQRATHSSPENYVCYLYCNSVLKTEYCQMRYVWQFSIRQATRLKWDPGVQLPFDSWLDILTLWSEIAMPLSCTPIPDLAAWPNQSVGNSASYIWDPGTILLWYRSIWLLLFIEEPEMGRLIPEQWSSWFNAMHYCQIFQKCKEMSSELYWHQDIKFNGIDLWMIHFLPP